ncbi:MAG: phosphoribosylglycinamide formyltransferase [Candidatus Thioglobus sp.]|jgi:phosphoribosylglycinamide formyltransferase-1|nr:phosphoribosylglycinamide formyltransferase [Candidatus Pseudothioglobus aerophilus]MBT5978390.1 phosphoribosylglycinamide formyltransferase [Gammaproteobacteria bacterium]MDP0595446.1 phosphoribosylglycinamide formyltransferase [Candidatus Thioglobus sp.]
MKAVILISGNGSNLQSIIDNADRIDLQISCVISNNKNAFGLKRAESSKLQTAIIDPGLYNSKEAFDRDLISIIQKHGAELIVLAGYMRVLTPLFVSHYFGKILNIHPSLLPKFPGLNTHQRAIDASEKVHGVSVHFVTKELDGGPLIYQDSVIIDNSDTEETLSMKVLKKEHFIYPKVIHWYTQRRLNLIDDKTATLDGKII